MTKIVFIIPPHLQFSDYVDPAENVKEVKKSDGRGYGNLITDMPLGPLALSSYLKKHLNGIETEVLDFNVELNALNSFGFESFEEYFKYFLENTSQFNNTDIFGISCLFSPSYRSLLSIARVLKKIHHGKIVMAGGAIPTSMYKDLFMMGSESIDLICVGEGEIPFLDFIKAFRSEKGPDSYIKKAKCWVTAAKARDIAFLPAHDFIWDLDEIPIYDYDLCGEKYSQNPAYTAYGGHQDKELNFHFLTSRGCPFHCIFCASHKVHGRKMRYYSMERVKEDLRILKAKGAKTILFQDDHFMGDQKRALEIVQFVGELGFKFIFQNSLALYALKRPFLQACADAGMSQLVLSVESGSERVLNKVMKKPLKLKIVEQVVQDCRDLGIYTYCNIVMGLPGETKEDIEDGRHFLKTIHADWFGIFIANPLVGSEMFDICIDNDFLQENWIGSDYKQAVVSTDDWDSDWIQKKAYQMNLELNLIENSNYRLGDYEGALEAFERVLKTKESHPIALYMAAKCLFRLNQPEKARSYLDTVLTVCRKDSFWQSHSDYFELDVDSLNRDYPPNPVASASSNAKPSDENRHFTNY